MKKVYFMAFIATAALTMMSCSNDDITTSGGVSKDEATAINFSTYLGRTAQTRGAETTTSSIQTSGFGVFASYTGTTNFVATTADGSSLQSGATASTPNFMYNQKVTYTNSAWTYDPVKYWPNAKDEKVSFFAYAPYSSNGKNDIVKFDAVGSMKGTPKLKVTVPTDLTNSVDFVAAAVLNQTKPSGENTAVSYQLQHEMTRLSMQAKVSEEVYKTSGTHNKTFVVIKSIKFNSPNNSQIYNFGTYTFSTTSTNSTDNSTINRGTWSDRQGGSAIDFSTILAKEDVKATNAKSAIDSDHDYQTGVKGVKLTGTGEVSLFQTNQYAFLIPVESGLSAETSSSETATISYDVVTEDAALAAGYTCASATKIIALPTGILKQGTAYTLTFTINVNEVKLSATAAEWTTDSTNGAVSVPASGSDTTL